MHNIFCCKHKSKEILPKKYSVLKRDDMLLGALFGFVDFYFRKHLDERERTEMNFQSMEKKYSEVISQLSSIITVDEMSSATFTVEEIVRKAGSVFESS